MPSCPCCGRSHSSVDELRLHLLTNHRKSALVDAILDLPDEELESRVKKRDRLAASV